MENRSSQSIPPWAQSLVVHALLLLGVQGFLWSDSGRALLKGEAGLAGAPGPRSAPIIVEVGVARAVAPAPAHKPAVVPVTEPDAITLPRELPTELKSEKNKPALTEPVQAIAQTAPAEKVGDGGQNGTGSKRTDGEIGNSTRSNELGLHLKIIRERIQKNLKRPVFRITGGSQVTSLKLKIGTDGSLLAVNVELTSGDPRLDQLAILAVKRAAPFAPYPTELGITIPAIFKGDTFQ